MTGRRYDNILNHQTGSGLVFLFSEGLTEKHWDSTVRSHLTSNAVLATGGRAKLSGRVRFINSLQHGRPHGRGTVAISSTKVQTTVAEGRWGLDEI